MNAIWLLNELIVEEEDKRFINAWSKDLTGV